MNLILTKSERSFMKLLTQKKSMPSTVAILAFLLISFSTHFCHSDSLPQRIKAGIKAGGWAGLVDGGGAACIGGVLMGGREDIPINNPFSDTIIPVTPVNRAILDGFVFAAIGTVGGAGLGTITAIVSPNAETTEKRTKNIVSWSMKGFIMGYMAQELSGQKHSFGDFKVIGLAVGLIVGIAKWVRIVPADTKAQSSTPPPAPTQKSLVSLNLNLN